MKKPFFSVLMPVYNAERFLRDALESVLNQTYSDFEFLIIDDGSIDRSAEIILSYDDSRIRYHKNITNLGISKSLNVGIDMAEADYIARMDSDDICYPDRLQRQYDFIQSHPDGAFFTCYAKEVTEEGELISISKFDPNHYFYNMSFSCWIYHPTMVYRKDAVLAIGKYTVPYAEDFELAWQLTRRFKHYHLPEILLDYRVNSQSLWQVTKKDEYKESVLQQVRRNIYYYIGEDSKISLDDYKMELLGIYYESLTSFSAKQIVASFNLQDLVTEKMIKKVNPNRDIRAIKAANKEKKEKILAQCLIIFPYYKACLLLLLSGYGQRLPNYLFGKIKRSIFGYSKQAFKKLNSKNIFK